MRFARSSSPLPIGIDVGYDGVRMVQLALGEDGPTVIAAARHRWTDEQRCLAMPAPTLSPITRTGTPLFAPAAVAGELNRMLTQGQFRGREVVLSMPRELVQIKTVRLPTMPLDDLMQAAEIEAQSLFGVSERNATIRAMPAGEVRQGNDVRQEVVTVCVRNADADTLVETWHAAGFRPVAIDFESAAIYRAVERFVRRRDDEAEVNVFVEIGARRTNVVIGRGRELNFLKSFEIGGGMLTHAVARKLGIGVPDAHTLRARLADTFEQVRAIGTDPVRQAVVDAVRPICEEAAREVALCLRYYSVNFRGQRPSRVRIVGGESSDPTIVQLLANALPVPVEVGRPILNADCSLMKAADRTEAMGQWTHAFGLALKPTKGNFADRQGSSRAVRPADRGADGTDTLAVPATAPTSAASQPTSAVAIAATSPTNRIEIVPEPDLTVLPFVAAKAATTTATPEVTRA